MGILFTDKSLSAVWIDAEETDWAKMGALFREIASEGKELRHKLHREKSGAREAVTCKECGLETQAKQNSLHKKKQERKHLPDWKKLTGKKLRFKVVEDERGTRVKTNAPKPERNDSAKSLEPCSPKVEKCLGKINGQTNEPSFIKMLIDEMFAQASCCKGSLQDDEDSPQ